MSENSEVVSPTFESVTVAPGRSLVLSLKWADPEGVEHGAAHIAGEGEAVELPAPTARVLRAEGVIL